MEPFIDKFRQFLCSFRTFSQYLLQLLSKLLTLHFDDDFFNYSCSFLQNFGIKNFLEFTIFLPIVFYLLFFCKISAIITDFIDGWTTTRLLLPNLRYVCLRLHRIYEKKLFCELLKASHWLNSPEYIEVHKLPPTTICLNRRWREEEDKTEAHFVQFSDFATARTRGTNVCMKFSVSRGGSQPWTPALLYISSFLRLLPPPRSLSGSAFNASLATLYVVAIVILIIDALKSSI